MAASQPLYTFLNPKLSRSRDLRLSRSRLNLGHEFELHLLRPLGHVMVWQETGKET